MSHLCNLCPNRCGVDRTTNLGKCLSPSEMIINRIAPHFYEEPPISGTSGSGAIFFGGCTMKCVFCQNYTISRKPEGATYTPKQLAEEMAKLEDMGVHNINLVSPTHYVDKIKEALDIYRPSIPIVYNTSGYELPEVIKSLEDYIDIYLPDFKYMDNALAKKFSMRENYPEYAIASIREMLRQKQNTYDEFDIMQTGVIIRHLILPGYMQNSIDVLAYIAKHWGTEVQISIMSQFSPIPDCKEPCRKLRPIEDKLIMNKALELGFVSAFTQELSSATLEYTPIFYK